jgi:hypothetical protein
LIGGLMERFTRSGLTASLRQRLDELDASTIQSVAVSSGLLRFAIATHLVQQFLPSGRSVEYIPDEDEEIPSIPVSRGDELASALTAPGDAIAEEPSVEVDSPHED